MCDTTLVSFVHFWPKLAQKKLLFLFCTLFCWGVCVTTNKFCETFGPASKLVNGGEQAYHVILATHHNHQLD
jgi:hypothetical protein